MGRSEARTHEELKSKAGRVQTRGQGAKSQGTKDVVGAPLVSDPMTLTQRKCRMLWAALLLFSAPSSRASAPCPVPHRSLLWSQGPIPFHGTSGDPSQSLLLWLSCEHLSSFHFFLSDSTCHCTVPACTLSIPVLVAETIVPAILYTGKWYAEA